MTAKEEVIARGVPEHIAIIMDGNGRWAKNQGKKRSAGHKEGMETAQKIVKAASNLGVKFITLYTFSTENWKRTEEEVGFLMNLIRSHLSDGMKFYIDNKIKIDTLGDMNGLPKDIQKDFAKARKDTENFTGTTCFIAINYGGKDEITRAVRKIVDSGISSQEITEDTITKSLDNSQLPPVDLMIRTGGEKRLSNFLLWQAAYSEFIFSDTLWPDYNEDELIEHIKEFQNRTRRFGGVIESN